ncbi:MAG: DUF3597 domain-containing protein, partial [Lacisediminimonas sp.]|nr:DUF3597 domain-containing protein [Lacisediminimonas sp.]
MTDPTGIICTARSGTLNPSGERPIPPADTGNVVADSDIRQQQLNWRTFIVDLLKLLDIDS